MRVAFGIPVICLSRGACAGRRGDRDRTRATRPQRGIWVARLQRKCCIELRRGAPPIIGVRRALETQDRVRHRRVAIKPECPLRRIHCSWPAHLPIGLEDRTCKPPCFADEGLRVYLRHGELKRTSDSTSDLVLQGQYVAKIAVMRVGPQMRAGMCVDQLRMRLSARRTLPSTT